MVKATIYIEGGAPGPKADAQFREAWRGFFRRAGIQRPPAVVRGRGRTDTYDDFRNHIGDKTEDSIPLLLVDSEDVVTPGKSCWQHLKERKADGWNRPEGATEDSVFLMICTMETWFLADLDALKVFFHPDLREKHLPPEGTHLESKPKADVIAALDRATARCKRPYGKGRLSFELLSTIDPIEVEKRCPAAKRLLDRLRSI